MVESSEWRSRRGWTTAVYALVAVAALLLLVLDRPGSRPSVLDDIRAHTGDWAAPVMSAVSAPIRGLRSILRHDPDKIMVGEIRDSETAQIAIQSALTGHLVFTTVHANNVLDVLGRFLNMGVSFHQTLSGTPSSSVLIRNFWSTRKPKTIQMISSKPIQNQYQFPRLERIAFAS